MSPWLLALLLAVSAAPPTSANDALQSLDACIGRLEGSVDIGYARVAARCPDLQSTLTRSDWGRWLPPDWNKPGNQLSVDGLAQLRTLVLRQPEVSSPVPRVASLGAVLAELDMKESAHRSWWARFKEWLHEIFTPRPAPARQGWLERLTVSQLLERMLVGGVFAVLLALVGAVLVNELRVAGLLGPARRRSAPAANAAAAPDAPQDPSPWREASPAEQPRLLLEAIVARLMQLRRLPPARALTLHELAQAAQLASAADHERLAGLADTCERLRFGSRTVPQQALSAALTQGGELLAALEAPLARPRGAAQAAG
jgi:hypothetical protein